MVFMKGHRSDGIASKDLHAIADYDLHRGWWYHSCPLCTKSVSDKGAGFKCIEHNDVTPVPW
uniref:Uncharacterized protein n=1 Tax=Salix viminalis TaxID=40686 RepID=A0A6N2LLH4_SALVM